MGATFGLPRQVDRFSNIVRQVNLTSAAVTTVAGTAGQAGSVNGIGTTAKFNTPLGIALNAPLSTVYVADYMNNVIRAIVVQTSPSSTGSATGSVTATLTMTPSLSRTPSLTQAFTPSATLTLTSSASRTPTKSGKRNRPLRCRLQHQRYLRRRALRRFKPHPLPNQKQGQGRARWPSRQADHKRLPNLKRDRSPKFRRCR